MSPEVNWHARFTQQAGWTSSLRSHLYQQAGLQAASRVLEVGCGTGAILNDLPRITAAHLHGLDLDAFRLQEAREYIPEARFVNGNALALPYPARVFDVCFCHFLLLWVGDPLLCLCEMRRVTRSGGAILVMAEPDYSQRIDSPSEMVRLGQLQSQALQAQGAETDIGARLPDLFARAGIHLVENGSLQRIAPTGLKPEDWELEWAVLESDLAGVLPASELATLKQIDLQARQKGERSLFVPTHFAWGRV